MSTHARGADIVAADDDGARLDRWFKRHYPALPHHALEKLLRTGQVRVDGKRAKASDRVAAGQAIRVPPPVAGSPPTKPREPGGDLRDLVLYKDEQVIVLNKPPGLATQGGSGQTRHVDGMLDSLSFGKKQRPRLVHRLDRDTSGVLVIARTVPAAAALGDALKRRDASKVYWALTRGVPEQKRGTIELALAKEGGRGKERMTPSSRGAEGAKRAITGYAVLDQAGGEFAWIAAKPVTGRTHQIRVHLAALGVPIVGDFKYGGGAAKGRGEIADKLHLHARAIDIAHPAGGRLRVTAPLPPHMRKSWTLLGFDPNLETDPFPDRRK